MDVPHRGWGATRGAVSSIRLSANEAADGTPKHQLISHAETGINPEGMNLSPDGRWVVTTNIERSVIAVDDPRRGFFFSRCRCFSLTRGRACSRSWASSPPAA